MIDEFPHLGGDPAVGWALPQGGGDVHTYVGTYASGVGPCPIENLSSKKILTANL